MKDYQEYYIQGSDQYLIPRDVFEELIGGLRLKYRNAVSDYETEKIKNVEAIEYIEKHTMYFDKEYASIYGELCECEGYNSNRIHCVVGDIDLLKILKGEE